MRHYGSGLAEGAMTVTLRLSDEEINDGNPLVLSLSRSSRLESHPPDTDNKRPRSRCEKDEQHMFNKITFAIYHDFDPGGASAVLDN